MVFWGRRRGSRLPNIGLMFTFQGSKEIWRKDIDKPFLAPHSQQRIKTSSYVQKTIKSSTRTHLLPRRIGGNPGGCFQRREMSLSLQTSSILLLYLLEARRYMLLQFRNR